MWTQFPTPMFLNILKHNHRVYEVVFKYTAPIYQIENISSLHQPKLKVKENDLGPNPLETEPIVLSVVCQLMNPNFPCQQNLRPKVSAQVVMFTSNIHL